MLDKLPIELLLEVIGVVLSNHPQAHAQIKSLILLSHVCSQMQKATLSAPSMWNEIHIDHRPSSIRLARLVASRSKRPNLTVHVHIAIKTNDKAFLNIVTFIRGLGNRVLNFKIEYASDDFQIDAPDPVNLNTLLFALDPSNVESLHVTTPGERFENFVTMFLPWMPKLHTVITSWVAPFGILPKSLTFLSLYDSSFSNWPEFHLSELLDDLTSLKELHLAQMDPLRHPPIMSQIRLPNLERLTIGIEPLFSKAFFRFLRAPSLREVYFTSSGETYPEDDFSDSEFEFPTSEKLNTYPSVQSLKIPNTRDVSLSHLTRTFPNIMKLEISTSALASIVEEEVEDVIWPSLVQLVVTGDSSYPIPARWSRQLLGELSSFVDGMESSQLSIDIQPPLMGRGRDFGAGSLRAKVKGLRIGGKTVLP